MNFSFVSFSDVVSIAKKRLSVLVCGSGSSIMSTVCLSIALTDSTKVLGQDYKFTKEILFVLVLIRVTNSLLIVKASVV